MIHGQRQMRDRRREVGDEERALAVRLDQQTLMVRRVAGRRDRANAGHDLSLRRR